MSTSKKRLAILQLHITRPTHIRTHTYTHTDADTATRPMHAHVKTYDHSDRKNDGKVESSTMLENDDMYSKYEKILSPLTNYNKRADRYHRK